MYALPSIIVHAANARFEDGALVRLPPELSSNAQFEFYKRQSSSGWHLCPQGYHVYVAIDDSGDRFIVPGLIIEGRKRPKKKFYSNAMIFTERQIQDFTQSLVDEAKRIEHAKQQELAVLIHDLRALSSAIYNSAEEARSACEADDKETAEQRIQTVIATHTMLSIRIDWLDYLASNIAIEASDKIPVYKKVDKVVRCFRPKAAAKNVPINLQGRSYSQTFGPAILELVVYAIIDNAVKYSPTRESIYVTVSDYGNCTAVCVKSMGPRISQAERLKIFDKGVRSQQAQRTSQSGTGIGLSMAREIMETYFKGSITVHQSAIGKHISQVDYHETEFELVFPTV